MRFGILGRLRVAGEDGRAVAVTAARQRVLLAALLLSANRVVPAESLAETVWDGATPPGAANTIRSYVMRLRKVLGPQLAARIETRDPGYVVRVEPGELDLTVWEELYARLGAALTVSPAAADWPAVAADAAEDALDWLLRSLDVPPERIPEGLAERAAFYRDRLDGTRTLILVDNAASAAQVRPLIPAASGCLVLVTSRSVLSGLDDAHFLGLSLLPVGEAVELLAKVAGPDRLTAHDVAAAELVELCGRLPLAIRIAAAHLKHHPALSVADYVARLRQSADRLEVLSDEDRNLAVVFAASFAELPPAEQRLFQLLSLVPGPDFDAYAAANLLDRDQVEAERLLDSLLAHNLVVQRVPGRYEMHDLVRVYALRVGRGQERADADAARARLLDFYAQAAARAEGINQRVFPHRDWSKEPTSVRVPEGIGEQARGRSWLRAERENILAAIVDARRRGESARSTELTSAVSGLLHREGPWPLAVDLHTAAAEAERALGRRVQAANHLLGLGESQRNASRFAEAVQAYEQALTLYRDGGERHGEANVLLELGRVRHALGGSKTAMLLLDRALRLNKAIKDPELGAELHNAKGACLAVDGEPAAALGSHREALRLSREFGVPLEEARALDGSSRCRAALGDAAGARADLRAALALYERMGVAERTAAAARLSEFDAGAAAAAS